MRADHDDMLQAGPEGFERLHCIVVQEEQCAVKRQRARRRKGKLYADAAARE